MVRWTIERGYVTVDRDLLQIVEVYAPGENKETVKRENKDWTYRRELIYVGRTEETG